MADILSHSVATPTRESNKSYDPFILVTFGLLVIGLLIVTVASASAPLQESIQSALVW
jgi:hypothetical protein